MGIGGQGECWKEGGRVYHTLIFVFRFFRPYCGFSTPLELYLCCLKQNIWDISFFSSSSLIQDTQGRKMAREGVGKAGHDKFETFMRATLDGNTGTVEVFVRLPKFPYFYVQSGITLLTMVVSEGCSIHIGTASSTLYHPRAKMTRVKVHSMSPVRLVYGRGREAYGSELLLPRLGANWHRFFW